MTAYYVDNSGADGDGSIGSPWNNIAGHVNDLSAGDTMHVRGNNSAPARAYTEAIIHPTVDGASGNRITLRPYLSELVCIKNNTGGDYTFALDGDYWTVRDFEIDHNEVWYYGLRVVAHHVQILDNTIHNSHNHNIVVESGYTHTEIRDNIMYDFTRDDADCHGVMVKINCDYTIIDGNTIHDCSGDAVQFQDGGWGSTADNPDHCDITNNTCYRGTCTRAEQALDIKCSSNLLISDNTFYDYGRIAGDLVNPAINIHTRPQSDILIENNIIYHCRAAFILGTDNTLTNVTIRHNLMYDLTTYAAYIDNLVDFDFYNNTIVDAAGYGMRVFGAGWTGGILKNNLWYNSANLTLDAGVAFTATAEYNGRFDTTSDAEFVDAGTDTTGSGDPGFVDAANDDYRLATGSDCINAGVDIGEDYHGSAPDLGYHEYRRRQVVVMIV